MPKNPLNKLTLEDNLNAFIQVNIDNQSKTNQRWNMQRILLKKVKVQVEQLTKNLQK